MMYNFTEIFAYWDCGGNNCGENDANWEWCNRNAGGPCTERVETDQCPKGVAVLRSVSGDQHETGCANNYELYGCHYAYFAVYACKGTIF